MHNSIPYYPDDDEYRDRTKYSNSKNHAIGAPNSRGHLNRRDDHKDWSESDIKQTGLIDREEL